MEFDFQTAEVTKEYLDELQKKADELNDFIKQMRKRRIADFVKLRPLAVPRNIKDDIPVFGYGKLYNYDVWKYLSFLAKSIHEKSDIFYMDNYLGRPCIRSQIRPDRNVKKFDELSREQLEISGKMLDEMIAIYNKYFAALHKYVLYNPMDGSGERLVGVLPPADIPM